MDNIYFILNLPDAALEQILSNCVERIDTLRRSLNDKKCVVKLPKGQTNIPEVLNGFTELSQSEAIIITSGVEWSIQLT